MAGVEGAADCDAVCAAGEFLGDVDLAGDFGLELVDAVAGDDLRITTTDYWLLDGDRDILDADVGRDADEEVGLAACLDGAVICLDGDYLGRVGFDSGREDWSLDYDAVAVGDLRGRIASVVVAGRVDGEAGAAAAVLDDVAGRSAVARGEVRRRRRGCPCPVAAAGASVARGWEGRAIGVAEDLADSAVERRGGFEVVRSLLGCWIGGGVGLCVG